MYKKLLSITLSFTLFVGTFVISIGNGFSNIYEKSIISAHAEGWGHYQDYTYYVEEYDQKYIAIDNYSGSEETVTIPATMNGVVVRRLGFESEYFSTNKNVKNIVISEGIKDIGSSNGEGFFSQLINLKSITIPRSIEYIDAKSIGYYFDEDTWESVPLVGFEIRCYSGTAGEKYAIDNGIKYRLLDADDSDINDEDEEEEYDTQANLKGFVEGDYRYRYLSNNSVEIMKYYGNETIVNVPDTIKGKKVTVIGKEAFSDLFETTELILPTGIKSIGVDAFYYCGSLKRIDIPDGVTEINDGAFFHCERITSLTIPKSVERIGEYVFDGCSRLKDIYYAGTKEDAKKIQVGFFSSFENELKNSTIHYNHIHSYTTKVIASTCTNIGYTLHKCSTCGNEYKDTYTNATGHTFGSWTTTKQATCTTTGTQTRKCTVCGDTETKTTAKTAHTYKKYTTKATLSKNGSIVEKCTVCGTKKSTTAIYYPKTFTLAKTSYVYNGKVQRPTVTVKGANGKVIPASNYTVTYSSGCKNVGKYAVKVTFKGNYSGAKMLYYTIIPKGTAISRLTSAKRGFTAVWAKNATQTTGYQIQYTTDSKFKSGVKTVTINRNTVVSKAITNLLAGRKYYVRVRTYRTANKVNYFSAWSGAKAVTTKK